MGWNKVEGGSGLVLVTAKGLEQVRLSQFGFGLNLLLSHNQLLSLLALPLIPVLRRRADDESKSVTPTNRQHRILRFLPPREN